MPLLTEEQRLKYLVYVPCAVGPLSMIGSTLTMVTILRTRQAGAPLRTYHRLLAGISILDFVISTGFALGPLPMPSEYPLHGTRGNTATCSFQGFLLQLGLGSVAYSFMLMLYYLLVIRFGMQEKTISYKVEPLMHAVPILFYLTTAIIALPLEVFNPNGTMCWIGVYPPGCDEDPDLECERGGDYYDLFGLWLQVVPLMMWTILICVTVIILAFTVWWRYHKSQRFVFDSENISTNNLGSNELANNMEKRTRRVIVQCFLYGFTFFNMVFWSTLGTVLELHGVRYDFYDDHFWIAGLVVFFLPLQGLFNFLIYIRPRYLAIRSECPQNSRWFAIKEAIWHPTHSKRARQVVGANQSNKTCGEEPPRLLEARSQGGDSTASRSSVVSTSTDATVKGSGDFEP